MQEDGPFLPGIGEGAFQFFNIVHHPEAALGIGVLERIGARGCGLRDWRLAASRQFQQRLSGLARQVVSQFSKVSSLAWRTSGNHSAGTP